MIKLQRRKFFAATKLVIDFEKSGFSLDTHPSLAFSGIHQVGVSLSVSS